MMIDNCNKFIVRTKRVLMFIAYSINKNLFDPVGVAQNTPFHFL